MHVARLMFIALLAFLTLPARAGLTAEVDYQRDIKPILHERCFACHGALKQEGNLRLDTAALARQGGDSGVAIAPGQPDTSLLLARISAAEESERMPPEGQPLSPEQIALFKSWIAGGATGPEGELPEPDPNQHWSFQTPRRPVVPQVAADANQNWVRNPIDQFISAKYQAEQLTPVAFASPEVMLRRVYIDLIGLPPTREELHAFLADPSEAAYQATVDKLLASPQYGERWGRHWMDVWRYSDWYGRRYENDVRNSYPHVWRWRDWIVRSLNEDHGYDRMLREMLAADELAPTDDDTIVATGYLVRNFYSLNYDQWMRDTVEHTSKAFLGLRINCALCHDHKYDPISQEEYFKLRAFFEPLELRQDRVPGGPELKKFTKYVPGSCGSTRPIAAGLARIYDHNLAAETFMYRGGDVRVRFEGKPAVPPGTPAFLGGELKIEPVELPPVAAYPGLKPWLHTELLATAQANIKAAQETLTKTSAGGSELAVAAAQAKLLASEQQLTTVQARIAADQVKFGGAAGDAIALSKAASLAERQAAHVEAKAALAEKQQAFVAAEAAAKANEADQALKAAQTIAEKERAAAEQAVAAAEVALAAESDVYTSLAPQYPTRSTGRRTALAKWITRNDHPLTPRVAINHIWLRHFGQPLVESVFDFGRSGKTPTHPELLDWLSVELVENGWQMKHIHRLMVTSGVYRLQSAVDKSDENTNPSIAANLTHDQDNRYLWHFPVRRLEAEAIRDSILYAAGQLDLTMGGQELERTQQDISYRRSMYFTIHPEGNGTIDFNALFDPPDPSECYRRTNSIMPQQALATTNSLLVVRQGRLLARKLWDALRAEPAMQEVTEAGALNEAFITAAFERVLSRQPRSGELAVCRDFLAKQTTLYTESAAAITDAHAAATPKDAAQSAIVELAATEPAARARESFVRSLFGHTDFVTLR